MAYVHRTFFAQSGGLENTGLRETKIGLAATQVVRRFSQRSPQILGILGAQLSDRELCPRAKWRRERVWNPTLSTCKVLISLNVDIDRVRIPFAHPVEPHKWPSSSTLCWPREGWSYLTMPFALSKTGSGCAGGSGMSTVPRLGREACTAARAVGLPPEMRPVWAGRGRRQGLVRSSGRHMN